MHLSGTHISRFVANWKASVFLWLFITHFYFQWQLIYLVLFVSYCYHINISFNFEFFFTSRIFNFFLLEVWVCFLKYTVHYISTYLKLSLLLKEHVIFSLFNIELWSVSVYDYGGQKDVFLNIREYAEYCWLMPPIVVLRNSSSGLQWSCIPGVGDWGQQGY